MELARLAHEREEAMARQAHDLIMIERQTQLEMIRAGQILSICQGLHPLHLKGAACLDLASAKSEKNLVGLIRLSLDFSRLRHTYSTY